MTLTVSPGRDEVASPESMNTGSWLWIPGLAATRLTRNDDERDRPEVNE